ncbi:MAG: asparagine synthase-related protein [Porticoccaceae bacterium]
MTSAPTPMRNHFIGGWWCQHTQGRRDEQWREAMIRAARSNLPGQHIYRDETCCLGSDSLFQLDHISCAISGHPRWKSPDLQQCALSDGQGAALAAAYARFGEALLEQLEGAFSLLLFDHHAGITLAATDRLGQSPLYYTKQQGTLVVGSSASIVLAHEHIERRIQPQGLYNYVYFHMVPSPHAIYEGVDKLPAGHLLLHSRGELLVRPYYVPRFEEKPAKGFDALGEDLKQTLKAAVTKSIPANTRIGAFLSGGLDSSTVAGMLAEIQPGNAHAYSIGFSAKGYDEMEFARLTARHFGIQLHEYYVTPEDVVNALPLVAASYDEPFGNSSALPAYFCAKLAAEDGVQCLLAGDGGDELFGGNERYVKQTVFERYGKIPGGLRRGLIEPIINNLPDAIPLSGKARSYIQQANVPLPDRLQTYNFLHRHAANEIFADDFLAQVETSLPLELQRNVYQRPEGASTLNRMLYLDWQYTLADNDLRKVSHMCSLAGIDVTYPMLDDGLLDLCCQIPSDWKIEKGNLRHFYKQALKGWLHDGTINKRKQGFGLPFGVWMETHKPLQDMAYDHLIALKKRPYFNAAFIDSTIDMHRNHHAAYYGELIWILTVLEMWLEAHT